MVHSDLPPTLSLKNATEKRGRLRSSGEELVVGRVPAKESICGKQPLPLVDDPLTESPRGDKEGVLLDLLFNVNPVLTRREVFSHRLPFDVVYRGAGTGSFVVMDSQIVSIEISHGGTECFPATLFTHLAPQIFTVPPCFGMNFESR